MKLWQTTKRLVREDEGMEMVEWAIVGVVFAVAAALLDDIGLALDNIGSTSRP
jgi:hypothetical protein